MARFSEDTESYFMGALDEINVGLVEANKLRIALKTSLEGSEYQDAIMLNGRIKMKLSKMIQALDKIGITISREVRNETFSGYKPLIFDNSQSKDVTKSDSPADLIREILYDRRSAKRIVASLKPK